MNKNIKTVMSSISPKFTTYLMYLYNFGKFPNMKNPKDINEKLQYLKLKTYYNNPVVTQCVDKYRVRAYLEERGFANILPKLIIGGITDPEEIRIHWKDFPDSFVIKCNHGCGYNILVRDKSKVNVDKVVKQIAEWIKEDYWKYYCEPQYKNVKKCILVEQYLADDIQTYKFYCFNGNPKVLYVSENGPNGEKDLYLDYYDMEWNHLDLTLGDHLHAEKLTEKPKNIEEMVELARKLSEDFPFVRVDLYDVDGSVYFSELTFIPTGGNMKLKPESTIKEWGEFLEI